MKIIGIKLIVYDYFIKVIINFKNKINKFKFLFHHTQDLLVSNFYLKYIIVKKERKLLKNYCADFSYIN